MPVCAAAGVSWPECAGFEQPPISCTGGNTVNNTLYEHYVKPHCFWEWQINFLGHLSSFQQYSTLELRQAAQSCTQAGCLLVLELLSILLISSILHSLASGYLSELLKLYQPAGLG